MHIFNKYETVGIFVSIAVMALALGVIRFKTDAFIAHAPEAAETQGAVVAVSQNEKEDKTSSLEKALYDASTPKGELVKLVVDDVRVGTGAVVKEGDTLVVQYVGTTRDGVKFDSSYDRGEPFVFTVGKGIVIKGWDQGLIGMKVGGQRILVIPSDMAYGNRQVGAIPPNTPLVFAVELLEIKE